jgi:hypothetical protein
MKFFVVVDYTSLIKVILRNIFELKSVKHGENASVRFHIFAIRSKGNVANFATLKTNSSVWVQNLVSDIKGGT